MPMHCCIERLQICLPTVQTRNAMMFSQFSVAIQMHEKIATYACSR